MELTSILRGESLWYNFIHFFSSYPMNTSDLDKHRNLEGQAEGESFWRVPLFRWKYILGQPLSTNERNCQRSFFHLLTIGWRRDWKATYKNKSPIDMVSVSWAKENSMSYTWYYPKRGKYKKGLTFGWWEVMGDSIPYAIEHWSQMANPQRSQSIKYANNSLKKKPKKKLSRSDCSCFTGSS